jgi:hypothetical protein
MHPATFLGPGRRWEEFLEAKKKGGNGHGEIPTYSKKTAGWEKLYQQEMEKQKQEGGFCRRAAREIRDPLAIEAHDQAIKAIGTLIVFSDGWRCEGLKEMHPLARKALELFGVVEFANANPQFARPQFMKIYEQLVKRADEEAMLPLPAGQPALVENVERAKEAKAMIEAFTQWEQM